MFLLGNICIEVVLVMLFRTFSNVDIQFANKKLTWKTYTTKKALPITHCVKFINKREFIKVAGWECWGFCSLRGFFNLGDDNLSSPKSSDNFAAFQRGHHFRRILGFHWYFLKKISWNLTRMHKDKWTCNQIANR